MNDTRAEFLRDIAQTAAEHGIDYWAMIHDVQWSSKTPPSLDHQLTFPVLVIEEIEDDSRGRLTVTAETIEKGLAAILDPAVADDTIHLHRSYRKTVAAASAFNDAGDIDAELSDYILQIGLFGEVTYT